MFNIQKVTSNMTTEVKFLTKPKSQEEKVFKMLKVVFAFVLAFLALDFGFIRFRSPRINYLVKFISAFQTLAVAFVFSYFYSFKLKDEVFVYWYFSYIVEYVILVFALLFTKKTTFFDFCSDLWFFDVELGIESSKRVEYTITGCIACCFIFRCLASVIYCTVFVTYCIGDTIYTILFLVPLLCGDVFLIVCFIIYYLLYNRLKIFTQSVSNGYFDIVVSQYLYKSLVDIADNIKSFYDPMYVVPLFFHTIHMMITVFYPLIGMDFKGGLSLIPIVNVSVVQVFITLFLPAFASGLLSSQVEKLKVVLHERLLQERDQKHVSDIKRFICYIDARNLKTKILKIIPLDWHLPVMVFNLSVTYLIVMLQFSFANKN